MIRNFRIIFGHVLRNSEGNLVPVAWCLSRPMSVRYFQVPFLRFLFIFNIIMTNKDQHVAPRVRPRCSTLLARVVERSLLYFNVSYEPRAITSQCNIHRVIIITRLPSLPSPPSPPRFQCACAAARDFYSTFMHLAFSLCFNLT